MADILKINGFDIATALCSIQTQRSQDVQTVLVKLVNGQLPIPRVVDVTKPDGTTVSMQSVRPVQAYCCGLDAGGKSRVASLGLALDNSTLELSSCKGRCLLDDGVNGQSKKGKRGK